MGDKNLVKLLMSGYSSRLFLLKNCLLLGAFVTCILAAMNPRRPGKSVSSVKKGIDVAIVLDVSNSMLAADLPPGRLERAKQFIGKLIDAMPDDRFALILFAGKSYLQMPLSADHGSAQFYVAAATTRAVPQQGTVIGAALEMSERVFKADTKNYKSVLLITDGEDHDDAALQTAANLAERGVMINTVGIGSIEGTVINDPATHSPKTDENGNVVVSKLNENLLKEIADKTNGVYVHLQNSDDAVAGIKTQLSQIDKKAYQDIASMSFVNYFMILSFIALLMLLVEIFIPERRKNISV